VFAQGCGVASVFDLCVLVGQELSEEQREQVVEAYPAEEATMLDIKQAAESLGIAVVGIEASLDELQAIPGLKIIHLTDPAHFLVMARSSPQWVQLLDGGQVVVVPREEIDQRYSGHVLILEQEQNPGGPRLQLQEFHHSFGIAGVGQEVEHAFTVTNVGDEDLTVALQRKSCGAPTASIGKETLAPGESTDVTVSFTISYSGDVFKSAQLLTTDPYQPVAFVTVHGHVPPDVKVYPDRLYFSLDKGAEATRTIRLSGPPEMELQGTNCETDLFTVSAGAPTETDGIKRWELGLSVSPGTQVGEYHDTLTLQTSHEDRPLITIPITVVIRSDLQVRPATVFFGFVQAGEQAQQEIVIRSRSGADFTVKSAAPNDDAIQVGPPQQRRGNWAISIAVDTSQPGVIDGTVTITTDVPGEESLKVGVYAYVLQEQ